MLKKIFIAGAALIFMSGLALADATCETKSDIQTKITNGTIKDNPDFKLTPIDVTDAKVIDGLLATIVGIAGVPPFQTTDVKEVVFFRPNDTEKYDTYIAFLDGKGCKLDQGGLKAPETLVQTILKDLAQGGPGTQS